MNLSTYKQLFVLHLTFIELVYSLFTNFQDKSTSLKKCTVYW